LPINKEVHCQKMHFSCDYDQLKVKIRSKLIALQLVAIARSLGQLVDGRNLSEKLWVLKSRGI